MGVGVRFRRYVGVTLTGKVASNGFVEITHAELTERARRALDSIGE